MSGEITQGRRVADAVWGETGGGWDVKGEPGDYMKVVGATFGQVTGQDVWYVVDPAGKIGTVISHTVVEHEDGTITVSPSIFDAPNGWHGWLERGVWRSC